MTKPDAPKATMPGLEEDATPFVDDHPDLAVAMAHGVADMNAGHVVPHAEVAVWLETLARGERAPRPQARKRLD